MEIHEGNPSEATATDKTTADLMKKISRNSYEILGIPLISYIEHDTQERELKIKQLMEFRLHKTLFVYSYRLFHITSKYMIKLCDIIYNLYIS